MSQTFPTAPPRNAERTINALLERQSADHTLEREFYISQEIFAYELHGILARKWLFVEHSSQLKHPGDYVLYNIANHSLIVLVDHELSIRTFANICRHRGTRICTQNKGNLQTLTCRYHGWQYALDGRCIKARGVQHELLNNLALHEHPTETLEDLIYICLDDKHNPNFNTISNHLQPYLNLQGTNRAKIAHRQTVTVNANWKLVIDNFRECGHCYPVHRRYSTTYAHVDAYEKAGIHGYENANETWKNQSTTAGVTGGTHNWEESFHAQPHSARRRPIGNAHLSLTRNGTPCAPLMGEFDHYDGGDTVIWLAPLHIIWGANDHVVLFRFTPINIACTEIQLTWLVNQKAKEGSDYDVDEITWLWSQTVAEDAKIIEQNQEGIQSHYYCPGPYMDLETSMAATTKWYLEQLRNLIKTSLSTSKNDTT